MLPGRRQLFLTGWLFWQRKGAMKKILAFIVVCVGFCLFAGGAYAALRVDIMNPGQNIVNLAMAASLIFSSNQLQHSRPCQPCRL